MKIWTSIFVHLVQIIWQVANYLEKGRLADMKIWQHRKKYTLWQIKIATKQVCCIAIKKELKQVKCYLYFIPFTKSLKGKQSLRAI